MCSREAIIFQATENNIISFLKNSLFAERSEIRTLDGKRFLTTIKGKWIDICPDRNLSGRKVKTADFSCEGRAKNATSIKTDQGRTIRRISSADTGLELVFLARVQ